MKKNIIQNIIFTFVFILSTNTAFAMEKFPKPLTVNDARQYFAKNPKIQMRKPGYGFDFMIKGGDIERDCADCHTVNAYGSVIYKGNKICFDWEVSFPPSGCFNFVQVNQGGFELQNDYGEMVYAWGNKNQKVVIKSGPAYKDVFERAILIDLEDKKPAKEKIHGALIQAMKNKGWSIEKDKGGIIIANLDRSGTVYRVMAKIRGSWVGIGFVQGYAQSGDAWIYNIKKQFLIQLGYN